MSGTKHFEVPDGAGILPLIPDELGICPLLLAVLHATVFLAASDDTVVNPQAADEAFDYMAGYLRRMNGIDLSRTRGDLATLVEFGRQEKWPAESIQFIGSFLTMCGTDDEANHDDA